MKYGKSKSAYGRRMTRRELLRAGAIGGASIWALSALGCGQGETKQPAKPAGQPKQPKSGGTLSLVATFQPQGMDPHRNSGGTMRDINDFFYGTPLKYKPSLTAYEVDPDLVESWEQPDALTYILRVRKGVKWHNIAPLNGRELTSDDINYSILRIATNKAEFQQRWMFADVAKMEAVDKYTSKLTTKNPFVPILFYLADRQTKIVPREIVEAKGDVETVFIGTGPFMMDKFNPSVGAKLKKNPDYFVSGRPYLDGVTISVIADASARIAALRSREIDHAPITFSDMDALKKNPGDLLFASIPGSHQEMNGGTNLRMRLNKPPFNDVRVRRALQIGVDRKKLIDAVADGKGIPAAPLAPYLKELALPEAELSKYIRFDQAEAKKLLAEAGYSSGLKFTCNVSNGRKGWADTAVALKEQYKPLGIDLEVKVMEHSAYVAAQVARDFETMVGGTQIDGPDPDFLFNLLHTKGPRQFSSYSNPKMDELLEKQRGIFNKEERKKVLLEIQRLAIEDAPEVHLFQADGFSTWQPYLVGHEPSLGDRVGLGFRRCFDYWLDK